MIHRRDFLRAGASAMALKGVYAAAQSGQGPEKHDAAKVRRVGLIGAGWYGKVDLFHLMQVSPVEVVSLCDVDRQMLAEAADLVSQTQVSRKKPRTYSDYRKMLAEKDLDIVLVGTPDHWHALPTIEACKAGADVYCQKPLSVDVVEGQAMLTAARQNHRVVQVGTQRRSTPHLAEARERFIKSGKLGKIASVEICCYFPMRTTENPPDTTPPDYLDYEMWTGPAPKQPYNKLIHPRAWRAFMEYGNGIVGDMAVHMFDMTRWMMDLGWPTQISSSGGIFIDKRSRANITDTQSATFTFPELNVHWQHRSWGSIPDADPRYAWSAIFYGDKGTLKACIPCYDFIGANGEKVHQDALIEAEKYPADKAEGEFDRAVSPGIRRHMLDFLAAIDSRSKPVADIEQGYISTASCILANNSVKLGRSIAWDAGAGRAINDDAANQLLARPYRTPWIHPG